MQISRSDHEDVPPPPSPTFPPTARPTVCPLLRDIMLMVAWGCTCLDEPPPPPPLPPYSRDIGRGNSREGGGGGNMSR